MLQDLFSRKWQGMVFIIICPPALTSTYCSLKFADDKFMQSAALSASSSVMWIIRFLQQAPHVVQSISFSTCSLILCTRPSMATRSLFFKNVRKASFSSVFFSAFSAMVSLLISMLMWIVLCWYNPSKLKVMFYLFPFIPNSISTRYIIDFKIFTHIISRFVDKSISLFTKPLN